MPPDNVEIVRGYFEVLGRVLNYAAADPRPLEELPLIDDVFERLTPQAEWNWPFTPETFRGREELLRAAVDWLDSVDNWRIEIEELLDAPGERVVAVTRVRAEGKGSGAPVDQRVFTVVTLHDGKVARIDDYLERDEALRAAGLSD